MEFLNINVEAPVDVVLRTTNNQYHFGCGPNGEENIKVAICQQFGMCQVYVDAIDTNGVKYIHFLLGPFAFRESNYGIQFYDSCSWRNFDKLAQEQWAGYKAEEAILGDD